MEIAQILVMVTIVLVSLVSTVLNVNMINVFANNLDVSIMVSIYFFVLKNDLFFSKISFR